jgi:hypothetical protein
VNVREFLREAGGNWLRADVVEMGDRLEILGSGKVDNETFDSPYLVLPMRLMRTGEDYNVRLGAKNTQRLADGLGTVDTERWVGRLVEVVSIETYKGLGTKGFILIGLPPQPKQETLPQKAESPSTIIPPATPPQDEGDLSPEAVKVVRTSRGVIEMGFPLNEEDWNTTLPVHVRLELAKKGLVEKRGELYFFTEAAKQLLSGMG